MTIKDEILIQLYSDPILFNRFLFPNHFYLKTPQFHKEIVEFLLERNKYSCIVAPRSHAKSTLIDLGFVLYEVLFDNANFVVIISDTLAQAKYYLDTIKKELEHNQKILDLFGDLKGRYWGSEEIELVTGKRIVVKGSEQKIRGLKYRHYRPDLIVCDDLENEEIVATKESRDKFERWFYGSVIPALSDDGRLIVVGTILHYASFLNKISYSQAFKTKFYKAITDNNKPLWEEKFSISKLQKIKNDYMLQGLIDVFYCEYMNTPISDENRIFRKEMFKYYQDTPDLINKLNKFVTVDLAIGKKNYNDFTVILVCGVDEHNNLYILDYKRGRYEPNETIDLLFQIHKKWNPLIVGLESGSYQNSMKYFVEYEMRRRNYFFKIEPLKADADKERRVRALQPRFAIGSVYHKPNMIDLEEELLLFPKARHDDIIDALAYIPQIAFPSSGTVKQPKLIIEPTGRKPFKQFIPTLSDYT